MSGHNKVFEMPFADRQRNARLARNARLDAKRVEYPYEDDQRDEYDDEAAIHHVDYTEAPSLRADADVISQFFYSPLC